MDGAVNIDTKKRYLSVLDVWSLSLGCMVGWGAFVMPGSTFLPVAGPAGSVIAMFAGMVIMLIIGNNFAFLMKRTPEKGGIYSYTREAFGREHAFLSSWFLCLSYLTIVFMNGTALFVVLRTVFGDAIKSGFHYIVSGNKIYFSEVFISVIALSGAALLFITSRQLLHWFNSVLAILMTLGVGIVAVICIPHASGVLGDFGSSGANPAYGICSIVFLAPWAFVGFEVISFDTSRFRFPVKKSKHIIVSSIIVAALAYGSMVLVGVSSVPDGYSGWAEYISDINNLNNIRAVPTFYAAKSIMGTPGLVIISIAAFSAVITGIIGGYRATINVLNTMADDKILSENFSKSVFSILFVMFFSVLMALLGRNTLSWFVDLTSFGAIMAFGYTSAAAYKLASRDNIRQVRITGFLGTAISVVFVFVQIVPRLTVMEVMGAEAFLLLSFWCLLGFVFYWRTISRGSQSEYRGMSVSGVILFALLVYSVFMWLGKRIVSKESVSEVRAALVSGGIVLLVIVFTGLTVLLYIQTLLQRKHEASEREKIRAVESNNAKSQFLFNMSHDLRTPMNAIIGYTDLAIKEADSPALSGYLSKIKNSNKQLLTLINDILEMSRIESGKLELEPVPADLSEMFDDIRELFEEQMKQKKIEFKVDTSELKDRYVWCDIKNLNRVVINLLSNAYKFTPEKGKISASVLQSVKTEEGHNTYEIRVRDTGIGMSKEFVAKMFSPFERERTSTVSGIEGTGLGLSICKSIIDLMGGTFDVHTSPGNGTEIILKLRFLPAREELVRNEEECTEDNAAETDFTGKRLLLVEDNAVNMEIAGMILAQSGFEVETAENGKVALEMVSGSEPGHYDAVLMDVQMPVMDGYTAAKEIRSLENKALAEIPIIAMTANAFREDEKAALAAGMQGHIAKPIDVKVLMCTLSKLLCSKDS
ncbi:MAG: amino acid permease [Oscillospiraceae bacterium]|nr:amino acid permease [Oscillospiraceae bacterium]